MISQIHIIWRVCVGLIYRRCECPTRHWHHVLSGWAIAGTQPVRRQLLSGWDPGPTDGLLSLLWVGWESSRLCKSWWDQHFSFGEPKHKGGRKSENKSRHCGAPFIRVQFKLWPDHQRGRNGGKQRQTDVSLWTTVASLQSCEVQWHSSNWKQIQTRGMFFCIEFCQNRTSTRTSGVR